MSVRIKATAVALLPGAVGFAIGWFVIAPMMRSPALPPTQPYAFALALTGAEATAPQQDELPAAEDQPRGLAKPAKVAESVSEPVEPGPQKAVAAPVSKPTLTLYTGSNCPPCVKLKAAMATPELAEVLLRFDVKTVTATSGQIPRLTCGEQSLEGFRDAATTLSWLSSQLATLEGR